MQFQSTRDPNTIVSSSEAILCGLAPDGGLFVPTAFPKAELEDWKSLSYPELAQKVLAGFLTDYDPAFLGEAAAATYGDAFAGKAGYVQKVHDGLYSLELWHGPTCAFKDYALQLMPKLLVQAKKNLGRTETTRILVATSGDTGKAALAGYAGLPGIEIEVFYPDAGTSEIQRLQMATQAGDNVSVYAVNGNFDDAQTGVKKIFGDKAFAAALAEKGCQLSSANSINIGRLIPQIVYYIFAYKEMVKNNKIKFGEEINYCVPTGNYGNVLAGYYAKCMGLPVHKFIVASNANNVLFDFLKDGVYDRNRPFYKTISPSMDILISSNLERLLYYKSGKDAAYIASLMKDLETKGSYQVKEEIFESVKADFTGGYCDDEACAQAIKEMYEQHGYVMDPHTAVAYKVMKDYEKEDSEHKCVLLSTASPYKFAPAVYEAIFGKGDEDEFACMKQLEEKTGAQIPAPLKELSTMEIRHNALVDKDDMEAFVQKTVEEMFHD